MTTTDGAAPIKTEGLTKHYGDVKALVELDLEVRRGEVFGFLGPNGAGKTTTIRSLLHFLFPTAGSASVLGLDVATEAVEVRSRVAYVPSEYSLYPKLTGAENLTYLANLRGGVDVGYVNQLAERLEVDLTPQGRRPLHRQQAEGRAHPGLHEQVRAGHPRRAQHRPRPAHAAGAAGTSSARSAKTAAPSSSPATASPRSSAWPTA